MWLFQTARTTKDDCTYSCKYICTVMVGIAPFNSFLWRSSVSIHFIGLCVDFVFWLRKSGMSVVRTLWWNCVSVTSFVSRLLSGCLMFISFKNDMVMPTPLYMTNKHLFSNNGSSVYTSCFDNFLLLFSSLRGCFWQYRIICLLADLERFCLIRLWIDRFDNNWRSTYVVPFCV